MFEILIAEPWDFKYSHGNNIVKGEILSIVDDHFLVFKANHVLDFEGISGTILILSPRLKNSSFDDLTIKDVSVNGGLLLGDYHQGLATTEIQDNCKFVLIGTLRCHK